MLLLRLTKSLDNVHTVMNNIFTKDNPEYDSYVGYHYCLKDIFSKIPHCMIPVSTRYHTENNCEY